ncbi:MAG: histidine kinase, partial [Coleofasciculus sp. C2-GNP5-27]
MHYPPSSSPLGQQIISRIIASPNPQTLLASIAQVLGEAFQVDCCLIAAFSPETAIPQLGLWYAEGGSKLQPQPQNLGQYLWLTGTEKPLAIRDI